MNNATCAVDECERARRKRQWCDMHYNRWRSAGSTERPSLDDRLWAKVDKGAAPGDCWVWTGKREKFGYGKIKRNGRSLMAHRYMFERFVGAIPDGYEVDHLCKNPPCVNPAHLEAVPPIVNRLRSDSPMSLHARQVECVNGHPFTEENTYRPPSRPNCRLCRTCRRERSAAAEAAKSACRAGHPYPTDPPRDQAGRRYCVECRAASLEKARTARWETSST